MLRALHCYVEPRCYRLFCYFLLQSRRFIANIIHRQYCQLPSFSKHKFNMLTNPMKFDCYRVLYIKSSKLPPVHGLRVDFSFFIWFSVDQVFFYIKQYFTPTAFLGVAHLSFDWNISFEFWNMMNLTNEYQSLCLRDAETTARGSRRPRGCPGW